MKKVIASLIVALGFSSLQATEVITIASSYNAGHSGQPVFLEVLEAANRSQNSYRFVLENHPGAQGLLALNYAKAAAGNRLALIAAGGIEHFDNGKHNLADWRSVYGVGDACWVVATNWPSSESLGLRSLAPANATAELVIGAPGLGSVAHFVGLEMAEATKRRAIVVLFKSGNEALLNLAGDHGTNVAIDSVQAVMNWQTKNSKIRMIATTCQQRHPQVPHVPTLAEQGLSAVPSVFNVVLGHKDMPETKRREITQILDRATQEVGADRIFNLSGFRPAISQNTSAQDFFDKRSQQILALRRKYSKEITEAK